MREEGTGGLPLPGTPQRPNVLPLCQPPTGSVTSWHGAGWGQAFSTRPSGNVQGTNSTELLMSTACLSLPSPPVVTEGGVPTLFPAEGSRAVTELPLSLAGVPSCPAQPCPPRWGEGLSPPSLCGISPPEFSTFLLAEGAGATPVPVWQQPESSCHTKKSLGQAAGPGPCVKPCCKRPSVESAWPKLGSFVCHNVDRVWMAHHSLYSNVTLNKDKMALWWFPR